MLGLVTRSLPETEHRHKPVTVEVPLTAGASVLAGLAGPASHHVGDGAVTCHGRDI